MQKLRFIYTVHHLIRSVLRATLITFCFVLADDLHINLLNFVAGHGTVVQPVSINIVFGCKQAQQYSRIHQLSFIRAVGWSAQKAFALVSRAYHSYSRTLQFSCISYEVWVTARFDVLFKPLVTKMINTFLAHFRFFEKATKLFNATGHHVCSLTRTKTSIDILLSAAKKIGLKLA